MKPNIKKSFIFTLIYCMGFGGIILLIGTLYPVSNSKNISEATSLNQENIYTNNNYETSQEVNEINKAEDNNLAGLPPTPSPSPTSAPSPAPVFELTKGGVPEIENFFNDYYVANISCDYDLVKSLLTDPDKAKPLSELENETRFLDDIRDITCYIMKSYQDGAYIVYVYNELKYINIKTTYPVLDKFYLIKDQAGDFKIFTSEMDDFLKAYFTDRDQDQKVQELIQSVEEKAKDALEKDEDLRIYLEALYG